MRTTQPVEPKKGTRFAKNVEPARTPVVNPQDALLFGCRNCVHVLLTYLAIHVSLCIIALTNASLISKVLEFLLMEGDVFEM